MTRPRILIAHINADAYSESFIRQQIEYLPADTIEIYGGDLPFIQRKPYKHIIKQWHKTCDYIVAHHFGKNVQYFGKRALLSHLKKLKIDAVLAEYGPVGASLLPICKKLNLPMVVHFHGYDAWRQDILKQFSAKYRELFDYGQKFIVVSLAMKQQLITLGCPENKLVYRPYGVDTSYFCGGSPRTSKPLFVFVGRFVLKKAPHLTILAFKNVIKRVPDARLVMIGAGRELFTVCRELVTCLNLHHNIAFVGVKDAHEILGTLKTARAYVQHSVKAPDGDSEGCPVSILEASSTGIPIISTTHAGINQSVIHGKTGYLVEERDVDNMTEYMVRLAEDPELADRLGKAGRQHMIENYEMKDYISKISDVMNDSIVSHGKAESQ